MITLNLIHCDFNAAANWLAKVSAHSPYSILRVDNQPNPNLEMILLKDSFFFETNDSSVIP